MDSLTNRYLVTEAIFQCWRLQHKTEQSNIQTVENIFYYFYIKTLILKGIKDTFEYLNIDIGMSLSNE